MAELGNVQVGFDVTNRLWMAEQLAVNVVVERDRDVNRWSLAEDLASVSTYCPMGANLFEYI